MKPYPKLDKMIKVVKRECREELRGKTRERLDIDGITMPARDRNRNGKKNAGLTTAIPNDKKTGALKPQLIDKFEAVGGKDRWSHDCELLMFEWILNAPMSGPTTWLQDVKGYSSAQAYDIVQKSGGTLEWQVQRNRVIEKMQSTVVDRHIAIIEEVERSNISASKLSTARAMEMLAKGGFKRRSKDGGEFLQFLTPYDILQLTSALEKAQTIYRRAVGLDSAGGDINKLVARLDDLKNNPASNININVQQNNVQNNTIVQTDVQRQSELTQKAEETVKAISYEAVKEFIQFRRELKAKGHLLGKQVVGTELVDVSEEDKSTQPTGA